MFKFEASVYYSEKEGKLELKYPVTVVVETNGGHIEYKDSLGRNCRMNFYANNNGYLWTSLALKRGGKITGRINRLVYSNLIGEIPKGYQIDHIDRNRKNNEVNNLRLTTKSENNKNKNIKGEKNPFSFLKENEVKEILILSLEKRLTREQIAKKYNTTVSNVKNIRAGKNWFWLTKDIFSKYGIIK